MQPRQGRFIFPLVLSVVIAVPCVTGLPAFALAATEWNVGISGDGKGIEGFHVSVGEYYRVPEREVTVVHRRGIAEEELPVVFFLSQRAHVPPNVIVNMRLRHMSWMDITLHFGLSPEIYYVPVDVAHHPPHGRAYGYYHNHPRHTWKQLRMSDHDIVDQVNLRFLSNHYGYAPERIMRYRGEGRSFIAIEQDVRREKKPVAHSKIVNRRYPHEDAKGNVSRGNGKKTHDHDDRGPQKGPHR